MGYILYGVSLFFTPYSPTLLIVSLLLLGGSIFVIMVVLLTLHSINHITHLAAKERHRALHDELTELPNRTLLQDRIDHAISVARRDNHTVSVLLMDLDRFKEINDALGHFYGDYVLQKVAIRLRRALRQSDTLSRFGGDEFAVVLPGSNVQDAKKIAQKIAKFIEQPIMIEGHRLTVGVSIGITMFPDHGNDSESLIQHADLAMYEAKRSGIVYAEFNPEQDRMTWNRLIFMGELRDAMNKDQLTLYYQPKISANDHELVGVEVLVRWFHPDKGLLPAEDFILLAEKAGLLSTMTLWILERAIQQIAEWQGKGHVITIAVNLSINNLQDLEFPGQVEELLAKYKVNPVQLTMEITETSMMADPERVKKVVSRLTNLGIAMAIDDYGTGYSSLVYLRKFPAIEIKIDKSYISNMLEDEDNAVIVRSTIEMAHNIGRKVVAEGVEDRDTMLALEEMSCDYLQGYYISRPLPPRELYAWLEQGAGKADHL
ncbi:MAG: EAL domain-containing protein [Desulfobulbaceae bacterium]|nr:EAL domain-containing protein [Desulfobulbaceae bacterium]HIJ79647.1 EAL domain-containing protein [Deltaproteobacteria bacterium]